MYSQFARFLSAVVCWIGILLWLPPSATPADGDFEGEAEVKAAAKSLMAYMVAEPPKSLEDQFSESFLKALPKDEIGKILKTYFTAHGHATEFRFLRMTKPFTAEIEYLFEKDARITTTLVVESKAPHRISGIFFKHAVKDNDTFESIETEMKELPGTVAYSLARLGDKLGDKPRVLGELNGDKPLGVASGCKLVIFAALLEEVANGKRSWKELVTLKKELAVPLSGIMVDWPAGSPVTVHTLATLMIARSDNTAADHIIDLIGRGRVEEMEKTIGVKSPNRPFLKVGELIKLKLVLKPEQQKDYLAADEAGKRKLLDTVVKEASLKAMRPLGPPTLIDQIEWLYSTADMVRILDWLRKQDKSPEGKQILAVNSGLILDDTFWTYVGYKGGAEPGVLSIAQLLQSKDGSWYAFSIIWNNPNGELDLAQLNGFAHRLIRLAQKAK